MRAAQSELSRASVLKADDSAEVKSAELHCPERQSFVQQQLLFARDKRFRSEQHLLFLSSAKHAAACIPILSLTGPRSRQLMAGQAESGNLCPFQEK